LRAWRSDQCSRQKFKLSHSIPPLDMKSQYHLAPWDCGFGFRRLPSQRVGAISGLMHCGILAVDEYARASCNNTPFVIDDLYSREC
jgi:hypothetical protein